MGYAKTTFKTRLETALGGDEIEASENAAAEPVGPGQPESREPTSSGGSEQLVEQVQAIADAIEKYLKSLGRPQDEIGGSEHVVTAWQDPGAESATDADSATSADAADEESDSGATG